MSDALDLALLKAFGTALLVGALLGIEREKKLADAGEVRITGLRTFMLFSQAGALCGWASVRLASPLPFVAGLLALAAAVVAAYVLQARTPHGSTGLTTESAAVTTYLLGALCLLGEPGLAVVLAIATSAVLAWKEPLHGLVEKLGREDILAGLKLLIASFIVLPLLPDRPLDPWGALNPHELWLLVVLIAGLSLVGYVAVRALGQERGTAVTGATGGLVSSTAVTLSFARRSRETEGGEDAIAVGLLLAWAVMFVRVPVLVAFVERGLLGALLVPMLAMAAVCALAAAVYYRRGRRAEPGAGHGALPVELRNPFSLTSAARFGLLFALVLLAVRLVQVHLPGRGVLAVAALAGLTDVDAITLSMARGTSPGMDSAAAVTAIVVATLANTVAKAGMVLALGSAPLRRRVLVATGVVLAVGAATLLP